MMTRLPLLALGGIGALLALVIVAELWPSGDDAPDIAASGRPAGAHPAADAGDDAASSRDPDEWGETMLSRPLFVQTRRGPQKSAPTAAEADSGPSNLPRLAGILVAGERKLAIFQNSQTDKPQVVEEGESIAGWTVQEIAVQGVTMDGPGGTQVIAPRFDPNAVPAAPALPPKAPGPTPQQPGNAAAAPRPIINAPMPGVFNPAGPPRGPAIQIPRPGLQPGQAPTVTTPPDQNSARARGIQ